MNKPKATIRIDTVYGLNKRLFTAGKYTVLAGLMTAYVGLILSTVSIGKFKSDEYEVAHEFVDAVLG